MLAENVTILQQAYHNASDNCARVLTLVCSLGVAMKRSDLESKVTEKGQVTEEPHDRRKHKRRRVTTSVAVFDCH